MNQKLSGKRQKLTISWRISLVDAVRKLFTAEKIFPSNVAALYEFTAETKRNPDNWLQTVFVVSEVAMDAKLILWLVLPWPLFALLMVDDNNPWT